MCANRLVSSTPLKLVDYPAFACTTAGFFRFTDGLDMARSSAEVTLASSFTHPVVRPDCFPSRLTPCHTHGDKGARTPDLRLAKASLSQLSYVPVWE